MSQNLNEVATLSFSDLPQAGEYILPQRCKSPKDLVDFLENYFSQLRPMEEQAKPMVSNSPKDSELETDKITQSVSKKSLQLYGESPLHSQSNRNVVIHAQRKEKRTEILDEDEGDQFQNSNYSAK